MKRIMAAAIACTALGSTAGAQPADGAARRSLWFAPLPPLRLVEGRQYIGSPDFMKLFSPAAPWRTASRRVAVFKLYGEWVAYTARDWELKRVVRELKRRRIALAVEVGPVERSDACVPGAEEHARLEEGFKISHRIKQAGGTIRYFAFDEPFYYLALAPANPTCRWDGPRVARAVHEFVRQMRTVYPKAEFGDIEPLISADAAARYKAWIDAYREATGETLAFLHLDMHYHLPQWSELARGVELFARSRGIPFGLIYMGDRRHETDATWLAAAQHRFELYETEGRGNPEHAVLQSWEDKPDHVLPETRRTFTSLINVYSRPRSRLELENVTLPHVSGRLFDNHGRGIGNGRVEVATTRLFEGSVYPSGETIAGSTKTDRRGRFATDVPAAPGTVIIVRYRGSRKYWPAYARAGADAPSGPRNVARGTRASASASFPGEPPAAAVDGDGSTRWGAGAFAPQWIELDLGATRSIVALRLGVDQFPDGLTEHVVYGRGDDGTLRLLHTFRGRTANGQLLEHVAPTPWAGIRALRVETHASPSWIAWREIEAFASR